MRTWSARRWRVAGMATVGTALAIGLPTVLIPNPVFGREIATVWWNYPAWLITSVLAGLLLATYVADPSVDERIDPAGRRGGIGGLLGFLAVGCPVCNKLVLLAVGSSGAMTYFAPLQPVLAIAGIVLLTIALRQRLRGARACPLPSSPPRRADARS